MMREVEKSEAQTRAEAEVRTFTNALGPFVTAAEVTRMPMIFTNAKNTAYPIVFVNQAFLDLTGYEEHEVMGQSFFIFMEKGTDPEMLMEIRTAFRGGRDLESLVSFRHKKGKDVRVTTNIAPVRDPGGNVIQYFASFIDVTKKNNEEGRFRQIIQSLKDRLDDFADL